MKSKEEEEINAELIKELTGRQMSKKRKKEQRRVVREDAAISDNGDRKEGMVIRSTAPLGTVLVRSGCPSLPAQ